MRAGAGEVGGGQARTDASEAAPGCGGVGARVAGGETGGGVEAPRRRLGGRSEDEKRALGLCWQMRALQGLAPRLSKAAMARLPHLQMFYHGADFGRLVVRANATATAGRDVAGTTGPTIHIRTNNPIIEGGWAGGEGTRKIIHPPQPRLSAPTA